MRLINNEGELLFFELADLLQDEREFLQGGDDDRRALVQGLGQLGAVFVDFLDHAGLVFELADGFLQLTVEHLAVGNDDDRVEDLFVLVVVQVGQPVCCPGNGVRFARTG